MGDRRWSSGRGVRARIAVARSPLAEPPGAFRPAIRARQGDGAVSCALRPRRVHQRVGAPDAGGYAADRPGGQRRSDRRDRGSAMVAGRWSACGQPQLRGRGAGDGACADRAGLRDRIGNRGHAAGAVGGGAQRPQRGGSRGEHHPGHKRRGGEDRPRAQQDPGCRHRGRGGGEPRPGSRWPHRPCLLQAAGAGHSSRRGAGAAGLPVAAGAGFAADAPGAAAPGAHRTRPPPTPPGRRRRVGHGRHRGADPPGPPPHDLALVVVVHNGIRGAAGACLANAELCVSHLGKGSPTAPA